MGSIETTIQYFSTSILKHGGHYYLETTIIILHAFQICSIVESLHVREVACSASDHQGSNVYICKIGGLLVLNISGNIFQLVFKVLFKTGI